MLSSLENDVMSDAAVVFIVTSFLATETTFDMLEIHFLLTQLIA
jgi:hypothetical protein